LAIAHFRISHAAQGLARNAWSAGVQPRQAQSFALSAPFEKAWAAFSSNSIFELIVP
jgi:hypothetical protein